MPDRLDKLFDGEFPKIIHGSCVAHNGKAALIVGQPGCGKSALALQLLALGAGLVADDRTALNTINGRITVKAPKAIKGLIEARGVGILRARYAGETPLALLIDLDHEQAERLPAPRNLDVMGQTVPVWVKVHAPHFPAAILQFLDHGLADV